MSPVSRANDTRQAKNRPIIRSDERKNGCMRLLNVGKRAKIGDESVGGGGDVYFDFCRRWELTRKITITSGGHEFVSYDNKFGVGTNGNSLSVGQCEREGFDVTFRIEGGIYS